MADQPLDPSKPKDDSARKQPETVLLTAEELRAIAGGVRVPPLSPTGTVTPGPSATPKGMVSDPTHGR